jgi:S1-C subfamily serine protease
MGVSLIHDSMARRWGIKGLVIGKVSRGGSADRAGLRGVRETASGRIELGDIVVAVDGKPVETVDDFMDVMEKYKVGDRVKVDVVRNNSRQSVDVTLQAVK